MNYSRKHPNCTDITTEISTNFHHTLSGEAFYNTRKDIFSQAHSAKYASTKQQIFLPLSIFHSELSTLQILVKYLKDVQGVSFHEIAGILNRSYKTVWTTYQSADSAVQVHPSAINIPISIFCERNLSPLESIVHYLRGLELKFSAIAALLKKDQRTIWTVDKRARQKLNAWPNPAHNKKPADKSEQARRKHRRGSES